MRKVSLIVSVVLMLLVSQSLFAEGVGVTLSAGSLGLGGDVTVGVNEELNVRLGGHFFSMSESFVGEDEDSGASEEIDAELDLQTLSALLDWHPGEGGFRLSAGLMLNNNEVTLSAEPGDTVEIGNREYSVSKLTGEVTFDQIAPYIGLGFGNAIGGDGVWSFSCDLGVMFSGDPEVSLSATASDAALQPSLDAEIAEEVAEIEDDTEAFNMWPVIMLGASYKF